MGLAALWGVMAGCKPASVVPGPFPATAPEHPGGLRYYLGRDLMAIEATVAEYVETRIVSGEGRRLAEKTETGLVPVRLEVVQKTTADPSSGYVLDLGGRGLSDLSLDVRVGDDGLLTSVGAESRSRAGETLIEIARVAGAVAVAAAGFREAEGPPASSPPSQRRLESLSPEALYFLQESSAARDLRREVDRLEDELAERREALRGHLDAAVAAAEPARFSLAEKRAGFLEESILFLEKQGEKARAAFDAALRIFLSAKKLGRESRERTVRRYLEMADLPRSSFCLAVDSEADIVKALEKSFPRSLELYRETGLVVSFDPALPFPGPSDGAQNVDGPKRNEIRIYYREPVPGYLRVYAWTEAADPVKKQIDRVFRRVEEKLVFVLHPDLPVRYVGLDRKAFSSRSLRLAVNGQGRVVGLSKTFSSGFVSAASETVSSLAAVLEEVRLRLR